MKFPKIDRYINRWLSGRAAVMALATVLSSFTMRPANGEPYLAFLSTPYEKHPYSFSSAVFTGWAYRSAIKEYRCYLNAELLDECKNPTTLFNLPFGQYNLEIVAESFDGNLSEPLTITWETRPFFYGDYITHFQQDHGQSITTSLTGGPIPAAIHGQKQLSAVLWLSPLECDDNTLFSWEDPHGDHLYALVCDGGALRWVHDKETLAIWQAPSFEDTTLLTISLNMNRHPMSAFIFLQVNGNTRAPLFMSAPDEEQLKGINLGKYNSELTLRLSPDTRFLSFYHYAWPASMAQHQSYNLFEYFKGPGNVW